MVDHTSHSDGRVRPSFGQADRRSVCIQSVGLSIGQSYCLLSPSVGDSVTQVMWSVRRSVAQLVIPDLFIGQYVSWSPVSWSVIREITVGDRITGPSHAWSKN